ncbi:MAG: radical SAM protein [Candidatus Brocadiales bacterium]|nr:radical SAM protein [Candidatus Bathyanammoxibius sp.]MCQ4573977.1 radical SAM protein [Candidatus Bathyanammoxibius amoris]
MISKRKLVLINPHPIGNVGEENVSVLAQMPVNLGYLVSLTPDSWEVDVIDETEESAVDENGNLCFPGADLVGITSVSYQAPRAYQIAAACRKREIPVIMGGVHATIYPNEVAEHVDCVVQREAVSIWDKLLSDFEQGRLQKFYEGGLTPLENLKLVYPDREFLKKKYKYRYSGITTSAGCPFSCEFCSVPQSQGRKYRERPVEDVLDEMEAIQGQFRGLVLTDENFYGHSKKSNDRVRNLFKEMVERGIYQNWFGFTSLNIFRDDETLDYMVRSGCVGVLIGIESLNKEALESMNKHVNLRITIDKYYEAIKNIRKHGIAVWGTVIFGNDADTIDTFDEVSEFVLGSNLDIMTCGILCPFINTPLYKRLEGGNRLFRTNFPEDWVYYTSHHLVHILNNLSIQELTEGLQRLQQRLWSTESIRARFQNSRQALNNNNSAMFALKVNWDWREVIAHFIENLQKLEASGKYQEALGRIGKKERFNESSSLITTKVF